MTCSYSHFCLKYQANHFWDVTIEAICIILSCAACIQVVLSSALDCKHSDLLLLGIYKQVLQDNCGGFGEAHFFCLLSGVWFFVWIGEFLCLGLNSAKVNNWILSRWPWLVSWIENVCESLEQIKFLEADSEGSFKMTLLVQRECILCTGLSPRTCSICYFLLFLLGCSIVILLHAWVFVSYKGYTIQFLILCGPTVN